MKLPTSPCRYCGKDIVWGAFYDTARRKEVRVPLDPTPPTYRVVVVQPLELLQSGTVIRRANGKQVTESGVDGVYVSHYATCTKLPEEKRARRG